MVAVAIQIILIEVKKLQISLPRIYGKNLFDLIIFGVRYCNLIS